MQSPVYYYPILSKDQFELSTLTSIDLNCKAFESFEYQELRSEFQKSELRDYRSVDKYIYSRVLFVSGNGD